MTENFENNNRKVSTEKS